MTDVSLTVTEADLPCTATVSVSAPSVSKSFFSVTEMVAMPLESTALIPLIAPTKISAKLIPDISYATKVPDAKFVVVMVKVTVAPSLTLLRSALMA